PSAGKGTEQEGTFGSESARRGYRSKGWRTDPPHMSATFRANSAPKNILGDLLFYGITPGTALIPGTGAHAAAPWQLSTAIESRHCRSAHPSGCLPFEAW